MVINSLNHLYEFWTPPNQQGDHTNAAPQANLLTRLGQGTMAIGATVSAYGVYISFEVSHPREIRQEKSIFVFDCKAENGERYYDCRTNYERIPDRMKVEYGQNSYAICDKLTPPYILNDGVPAYYCDGHYLHSPIELVGPLLAVVGAGLTVVGYYCNKKGQSVEAERQIALTVNPINSFIAEHFVELNSSKGMKMGDTNKYVCLSGGRDCLTFEPFKDPGKDQVEWCLIRKGVCKTKTTYYLLQASSAKQISKKNPYTNLPLEPDDDILRGQAVLNVFNPKNEQAANNNNVLTLKGEKPANNNNLL